MRLVDGRRTIREIVATAAGPAQADGSSAERKRFAQALFASLVNRDFLALAVTGRT